MILDADLTVPPEDLPRFYEALASGHGEFINGVRLVYPMEDEAMRFCNLLGNKFFSLAFSLAARTADQGHALRHQGALRDDYETHRGQSRLLRRLRSVRRLRSAVRRGEAGSARSSTCRFGTASAPTARRTSSAGATAGCCSRCASFAAGRIKFV